MKRFYSSKRLISIVMALLMVIFSASSNVLTSKASQDRAYLVLGADLTESEKNTVLAELGVNPSELDNYNIVTITNEDEKKYLGSYIEANVIGSRALSSALIEKKGSGNGIYVTTKNISYCTTGMYRNALITAGVTDADVKVAGPFSISGTAALVGVVKAYEEITGEDVSEASIDAAVDELVTTGDLAETLGDSEKVEQLIALAKQYVVENDISSEEDIEAAILEAAEQLEITLTEAQMQQIRGLMTKISNLDIDTDALKEQAKELYNNLKDIGIDFSDSSFWAKMTDIFKDLMSFIRSFFE